MTTDTIASNIDQTVTLASGGPYGNPVTVASGVTVGAADGVEVYQTDWAIRNEGTIGDPGAPSTIGVYFYKAGGTVVNDGNIQGSQSGISQSGDSTHAITIDNTGAITGTTGPGVALAAAGGVVTNETGGFIYGVHGVSLSAGGSVTNQSGAEIAGSYSGIFDNNGALTADNAGDIHGSAYGIKLIHGGTITNEAGGTITGKGAGVEVAFAAGTVINAGLIEGTSYFAGIDLFSGGSVTNQAGGTIYGHSVGVRVDNGSSTIDNLGTITGIYFGIQTGGTSSTVENAGTISGATDSVYLAASTNRLIIDPGAVFNGAIAVNASGTNTLELGSGAAAGTLYGIDATHYAHFQTVTIDSGATWDIGDISPFETIQNAGTVGLNSNTGLQLDDGALVINTGAIYGVEEGIWVSGAAGSVDNSGLITASGNGTVGDGVYLENGGSVTNETGGTIAGAEYGVRVAYAGTVINDGSIAGTGESGVFLEDGGAITNAAGATITGKFFGVDAGGAATIDNAGTITATTNSHGQGVGLNDGGRLTNESTGLIEGKYAGVSGYQGATVINHGSIASTNGSDPHAAGVNLGGGATLINDGTVSGYSGVYSLGSSGDTVTNEAGGVIAGDAYGIDTNVFSGPGTIDNAGTITGTSAKGIFLVHGGTVTNAATGTISGHDAGVGGFGDGSLSVGNAGTIQATLYGVDLSAADNTLNNTGLIVGGTGARFGGDATTVNNSGTIHGTYVNDLSYGVKIYAATSGSLVNEAGGTIIGAYGVTFLGANATLENAGTIEGNGYDAVQMFGTVTNRLIIDPGAVFEGTVVAGTSGTSANIIELASSAGEGALYGLGSKYTGFQTVTIDSGAHWVIGTIRAAETILNAGTVGYASPYGGDYGVGLGSLGGSITNEAGGTIQGYYKGIQSLGGGVTVANAGLIESTRGYGVYVRESNSGVAISNASGGTISGHSAGIYIVGAAGTVDNSGHIIATAGYGVVINTDYSGSSVTNEAGGTIQGGIGVVLEGHGGGTVANYGAVTATGGAAVAFSQGSGVLINGSAGTLTGGTVNSGAGVFAAYAPNISVNNAGTIESGSTGTHGAGVYFFHDTHGTIVNTGLIEGLRGIFTNGDTTIDNAGTIVGTGGVAVEMDGTGVNLVILHAGAVFDGKVIAHVASAASTIELASGASTGTLSGLGSEYVGFQTVAIDSGATWDVEGAVSGFSGVTIQGFTRHDTIDLTNLTFDAGDRVDLNQVTDVLTVKDSSGDTLASIHLAGNFAGDFFHLADDGYGHTLMTEDTTPCYLKGTLIRTADGDVPVERLRIGHWVITTTGEALPIKWIGRRSYRDWLAVGNEDVQPILFKAGSIDDGIPARNLHVSPEHAMFIDGVLVPARHLVNGASIVKVEGMEEIDYFHLEFDRHVVIFAEDAPAESFVDDDSRMLFHNADEYRRLYPDEPPRHRAEFCAPRVEDGPALAALHQALATRAQHLRADGAAAPWGRRGKIEVATSRLIAGWAFSGADAGPVPLAVLVNGAVIGRVIADRYRPDLKAAGIGNGRHGFRFALPKGLAADVAHLIEVRREVDWSLL